METLIRLSLRKQHAVTVAALAIFILGVMTIRKIPVDILPVYNSPAVQVLTFYSGMPADEVASAITNRMERWTGSVAGIERQHSRSLLGTSVIRNYFRNGTDPNAALTQVNSLALAEIPNLPPGTLPPVVLPFDPTASVPTCIIALNSRTQDETTLYDVARYEVRNMLMSSPGANAPVVYGGRLRAVLAYLDRVKMQARNLDPVDVLNALEQYNVFLPTGHAMFGNMDYMIGSNSMYDAVENMNNIPLRRDPGNTDFLGDVADVEDAYLIQENVVRVNGRRQVYVPVFKQHGASTLDVVDRLRSSLAGFEARLSRPGIELDLVMDQSVYVRESIRSLIVEGILGALLCSLVILFFLGQFLMTVMAALLIPLAILACVVALSYTGQTVNVMTLAGMALAIGPLVDLAIVVLENTHRHLSEGTAPRDAALHGATEIVMPEIVATLSTLLVLAPLAMMESGARYLFKPMFLAVAYTMAAALILSMSFIPSRCASWLKAHTTRDGEGGDAHPAAAEHQPSLPFHESVGGEAHQQSLDFPGPVGQPRRGWFRRLWEPIAPPFRWVGRKWTAGAGWIDRHVQRTVEWYARRLRWVTSHRLIVLGVAVLLLAGAIFGMSRLRREFFPRSDVGSFEMYVRAQAGTRIDATERRVAELEDYIQKTLKDDLRLIISELGTRADWSAAYTPNAGPMDAVLRIQLASAHSRTTYATVNLLRQKLNDDRRFADLEFAFNAGGTVRSALNEGNPTPINVRIEGKDMETAYQVALHIKKAVEGINGVVDARILQRLDYPEYKINVDRAKARALGLTQEEVMKNVIGALNSSIQYNKNNFWIDPVSQNQYYVGVQYPEAEIDSIRTILNVPLTSAAQKEPVPLGNVVSIEPTTVPSEVTHSNLQTTIDLTMGIEGRDLGHVADDVQQAIGRFGKAKGSSQWTPYDPSTPDARKPVEGMTITMSGEFARMRETFHNFEVGLAMALLFIYFLMVSLLDSYIVPLTVLAAVPIGLVGIIPLLYFTGTALNVQSLLGIVFTVGIIVANAVLLTDFAQKLRTEQHLPPTDAVIEAARLRARPVVMTALATFFALTPMALAVERGSEANAPLGRAVIGGVIAGLFATLIIVPALYSLIIRDRHHAART